VSLASLIPRFPNLSQDHRPAGDGESPPGHAQGHEPIPGQIPEDRRDAGQRPPHPDHDHQPGGPEGAPRHPRGVAETECQEPQQRELRYERHLMLLFTSLSFLFGTYSCPFHTATVICDTMQSVSATDGRTDITTAKTAGCRPREPGCGGIRCAIPIRGDVLMHYTRRRPGGESFFRAIPLDLPSSAVASESGWARPDRFWFVATSVDPFRT
jgi:hypothetical protein